jgi:diguanylate cyclase (GGDEF)-like protein
MDRLTYDIAEIARAALKKIVASKRLPTPHIYEMVFIEAAVTLKKDRVLKYLMEDEKNIEQQIQGVLDDTGGLLASLQLSLGVIEEDSREHIAVMDESIESIRSASDTMAEENLDDLLSEITKLKNTNEELMESLSEVREELSSKEEVLRDLENMAQTDPLTQLFNRRSWNKQLEEEFERSSRYGHVFSIIILDVDYFKRFNDFYGHPVGDAILRKLGALLKEIVRKIDTVFRYGGEEFTILLPETNLFAARIVAERIQKKINTTVFVDAKKMLELKVTASIGVTDSVGYTSPSAILEAADQALYLSKQSGRNCIRTASDLLTETSAPQTA